MCQCLDVNRSSYYIWRQRKLSALSQENQSLSEQIHDIFQAGRQIYGTRLIKQGLARRGFVVSRRRIARLMQQLNLVCKTKRKFRTTTDSKHHLPVCENRLSRQFSVDRPDKCYVGDISYFPTQSGWVYLATVIDLYSQKIVGWSIADHMKAELVNNALLMAIWSRKPNHGLLWHTDRGSQYASASHRQILKDHGIEQSMSRKGNCWDNAVSESFFHTLKTELTHHIKFTTKEEAKKVIFEYIEVFYNRVRMHSANNYLSPTEFKKAHDFY